MDIKGAYNRIKGLVTSPTEEWRQISKESMSPPALIGFYMVQVLFLYFACSLLGNIIFTNDIEHTPLYKIAYVFGRLLLILTGFILSYAVILKLFRKSGVEVSGKTMFTLIFYSYLVIWVVASFMGLLANYRSLVNFLHLFSLYGLVLFWTGSELLVSPPAEKKKMLYGWSFIILTAIYLLIFYMLKKLIALMILLHIFTQI